MAESGHRIEELGYFAIVLSLLPATTLEGQQEEPDLWRVQTSVFVGGSTDRSEERFPLAPLAALRLEGSVKGYFWLGVEASVTFLSEGVGCPGIAGPVCPDYGSMDAILTPLLVARLVNTPWDNGIYFVGMIGRVRTFYAYNVRGGGAGYRFQRRGREFLELEVRRIWQRRRYSYEHWEFALGLVL
jgi:hypothetical protein